MLLSMRKWRELQLKDSDDSLKTNEINRRRKAIYIEPDCQIKKKTALKIADTKRKSKERTALDDQTKSVLQKKDFKIKAHQVSVTVL